MTKVIIKLVVVSIMAICVANGGHHGGHKRGGEKQDHRRIEKVVSAWERIFVVDNVDGATANEIAKTDRDNDRYSPYKIIDIKTIVTKGTANAHSDSVSRYLFGPDGAGKKQIMKIGTYCIVMDLNENYTEFTTLLSDRHDNVVRADNPEGTVKLTTRDDGRYDAFEALPAIKKFCGGHFYNTENSALVGQGEEATKVSGLKGVYTVITKTLYKWKRTFTGVTVGEWVNQWYPRKNSPGDKFIDIETANGQRIYGSRYVFGPHGSAKKQVLKFKDRRIGKTKAQRFCIVIDVSETYADVINTLSTRYAADTPVEANVPLRTLKITTPMNSSDKEALHEIIYGAGKVGGFCHHQGLSYVLYNTKTVKAKDDQKVIKVPSLRGVYNVITRGVERIPSKRIKPNW